jgi:hypothetical protein
VVGSRNLQVDRVDWTKVRVNWTSESTEDRTSREATRLVTSDTVAVMTLPLTPVLMVPEAVFTAPVTMVRASETVGTTAAVASLTTETSAIAVSYAYVLMGNWGLTHGVKHRSDGGLESCYGASYRGDLSVGNFSGEHRTCGANYGVDNAAGKVADDREIVNSFHYAANG